MTLSGSTHTGWTKHDTGLSALQSQHVCNRLQHRMVRHATHSPEPADCFRRSGAHRARAAHQRSRNGGSQGIASDIGIALRHFGDASDPWRLEPDPRP
jgi:hypothetical protein